jgi:hypothetical protein
MPLSLLFLPSMTSKLFLHTCRQSSPLALMTTLKDYTILLRSPTVAPKPHLFSPFDIIVKENILPLSCYNTFQRYHIFNQHIQPLIGWTLLGERRNDTQLLTKIFKWCLGEGFSKDISYWFVEGI